MELTLGLHDNFSVQISDTDIASIETVRDLLRLSLNARGLMPVVSGGMAPLAEDIAHWLAPTGPLLTTAGIVLYAANWLIMRAVFQLRVVGMKHLPATGAFVITPNHASDLDPMIVAAALPLSQLRRVYWAGDVVRLFSSRLSRLFCRTVHMFPVDERHPDAAVRAAARVLLDGKVQVWFPEGWRSPDGRPQRFRVGIGQLLLRTGAAAVPAYIGGAFEAMPRDRRMPRFRQITIALGHPEQGQALCAVGKGRSDEERVAEALRQRVIALGESLGILVQDIAA